MIGGLLVLALMGGPTGVQPQMSVCEFVENVKQLDGRLISVRGIVEISSPDREGFYVDIMYADSCAAKTNERIRVDLVYPDSKFSENAPPGYKFDQSSFRRAFRIVKKARDKGKSVDRILATIQGIAYAPRAESAGGASGRKLHHGSYDARIFIQAIKDVTVLSK